MPGHPPDPAIPAPPPPRRRLRFTPHPVCGGRSGRQPEQGIALLIVVSLLTVVGIIGVAFAFSAYLETQAARQFVATAQARYVAEAGVQHAWALLNEDRAASRTDDLTERWTTEFAGGEVDVEGAGVREAAWWPLTTADSSIAGRYAVQIADESGKINLNAAQLRADVLAPGALDLTAVLTQAGISRPSEAAEAIIRFRYGPDARPGKAGVDDNGNGAIDEPEEYQPAMLRGDDRRLESLEELRTIAGLSEEELTRLVRVATVYSWDTNLSLGGVPRVNVNVAKAEELLPVLFEAGVSNPWQAAVNIADDVDSDLDISQITRASQLLPIRDMGTQGDWLWSSDAGGAYASSHPGGTPLTWTVAVPVGTFRVLARGRHGVPIGDVTIAGEVKSSVEDGESLGMLPLSGTLTVTVANRESEGTRCAFRGLELVSDEQGAGVVVRGVEAVRFNELMVQPVLRLEIGSADFDPQGSAWLCASGSGVCSNSGAGEARWTWTDTRLMPGRYYLRVFGNAPGQTVGEVHVEGQSQLLVHGQRHPTLMTVGADRKITLTIGKADPQKTYFLTGISLSLQPDAEYAELINLSDAVIDVGGWTIDGELAGGRPARLPSGARLPPHGLLVAAVDLNDTQEGLAGNDISARAAWEIPDEANAVQLEFPNGAPSPDDVWLLTTLPEGSPRRLRLRSGSMTVDEVQYPIPLSRTSPFQSLEKADPSVVVDQDSDGIDDGWYPSLRLYTPGRTNDNEGLKERRGLTTITHDPSKEVTVLNRPLRGIGELAGLPSGEPWMPFAGAELAKVVDRLTVEGYRLEAEGHWAGGHTPSGWEEKADGFVHTDPAQSDAVGRWEWAGVPEGTYRLSLFGCEGCLGEQLAVRWEQPDGTFSAWSPALSTDAQGRMLLGQVTIGSATGADATPSGSTGNGLVPYTLRLEARCCSVNGICHVDFVRLDPQLLRVGPVNVNTAPREVLLTLPGMTESLVARLLAGRPYGDRQHKGWGIGDLLFGDVLGADDETRLSVFRRVGHLLTTRSDVFQIISVGQAMEHGRVTATQKIRTVIQR